MADCDLWVGAPAAALRGGEMGGYEICESPEAQGADFDRGDHFRDHGVQLLLRALHVGVPPLLWLEVGDLVRVVAAGGGNHCALLLARDAAIVRRGARRVRAVKT